jgi:ferric-dicitrate binding protein FerR (iron transport regulator)
VSLHAQSQVALLNDSIQSQVMRLERGGIQIAVPPPDGKTHRSVSVLTPHAKVMVKGTRFSVELLGEGDEGRTQVAVTRGVVEVEHLDGSLTLRAGQSWISGNGAIFESSGAILSPSVNEPKPKSSPSKQSAGSTKGRTAEFNTRVPSSTSAPQISPEQASTLAAQNELLEAALVAVDQGDHERALRLTSRLLSQYPSSPLRASARAVRKRVKAATEAPSVH